jgi:predicted phosphodiesterase
MASTDRPTRGAWAAGGNESELRISVPRLAIISDIHGNRVALEQVLRDCEVRNVDAIFCLGDIVGYGPEPAECLALVRSNCRLSIRGNHEDALLHPEVTKSWNPVARAGIAFARRTMSPDSLAFVGSLPSSFAISETVLGVHDSPVPTEDGMTYLRTKQDAAEAFGWFGERFCLVGHTHVPSCFTTGVKSARDSIGVTDVAEHDLHVHGHSVQGHSIQGHSVQGHSIVIELPKAGRSIINPGSVGQPRDRDPRASYAVLDIGRNLLELQRVEYDVAEVLRRSLAVGLPPIVGERLAMGA